MWLLYQIINFYVDQFDIIVGSKFRCISSPGRPPSAIVYLRKKVFVCNSSYGDFYGPLPHYRFALRFTLLFSAR
jgi:hypothetical protein